jgi:hypothetical protein
MYLFQYPIADTTLYEGNLTSSLNAGRDSILEIQKNVDATGTVVSVSRILIKFDYTDITRKRNTGVIPSDAKYYLNLYDATSKELKVEQDLFVYMVSGSWNEGTGLSDSNPVIEDGSSWKYRGDSVTKNQWVNGSDTQGGSWFTGSFSGQYAASSSFSLKYDTKDLRIDVTNLVNNQILSSSIYGNNGFIVKRLNVPTSQSAFSIFDPTTATGSAEHNTEHLGNLRFFSKETNTIYPPKLEVEWDDSKWGTGSLQPLSSTDLERLNVYFKGIKAEYKEKSKTRFRLVGRELYPTRGFGTTPAALTVKYLPSGSRSLQQGTYYSVKDASTDEVIIPFSTGSIVSCDSQGNFFNIDMNTFQPERHYKFEIKVVSGSGVDQTSMIYDEGYEFKVVR